MNRQLLLATWLSDWKYVDSIAWSIAVVKRKPCCDFTLEVDANIPLISFSSSISDPSRYITIIGIGICTLFRFRRPKRWSAKTKEEGRFWIGRTWRIRILNVVVQLLAIMACYGSFKSPMFQPPTKRTNIVCRVFCSTKHIICDGKEEKLRVTPRRNNCIDWYEVLYREYSHCQWVLYNCLPSVPFLLVLFVWKLCHSNLSKDWAK